MLLYWSQYRLHVSGSNGIVCGIISNFILLACFILAFFSCYLIYYNNEIISFYSVFCNDFGKNGIYFDIFPLKVWRLSFNCLPLHSLSEIISVGTTKEAFFENIYIDREVVREARRVGFWA